MTHDELVQHIADSCSGGDGFGCRVDALLVALGELNVTCLKEHLAVGGIIPERYSHDSAEEKMYAKYCDILIYGCFEQMGLRAELCKERADYADVIGEKNKTYRIVADGKAFRLSRTALNPKDFKIEPLNGWRKKASADYACLVGPLHEFRGNRGRIYREAVQTNCTLLSYIHLLFILSVDGDLSKVDFRPLWDVGKRISTARSSLNGETYWANVADVICDCLGESQTSWEKFVQTAKKYVAEQAKREAWFWEEEKKKILEMSREELQKALLQSTGIQQKIDQIKRKALLISS